MKSCLLATIITGAAADHVGSKVECVGSRAHLLSYEVNGETEEEVTDAFILVERDPSNDEFCATEPLPGLPPIPGPHGDKAFCFGANNDETCQQAKSSFSLIHGLFECQSCFVGVTGDFYFKSQMKGLKLQHVEVGFRNAKITGALEVHVHSDHAKHIKPRTHRLPSMPIEISMKAGPLPIDIKLDLPTHLEFSLDAKGQLDAVAGATIDADLGDHFLTWTPAGGLVKHNTDITVNAEPELVINTGDSGADIGLKLDTSLQIDVNKHVWYHINAAVDLPQKIAIDQNTGAASQGCLSADLDVPVDQEVEIYNHFLFKDISLKHFGPNSLLHIQKADILKKCVDVPFAAMV